MRFFTTTLFLLSLAGASLGAQSAPVALAAANITSPAAPTATEAPALPFHRALAAFPATEGSLADFIAANLTYPELAVEYAAEGMVVLSVEVAPNGKVTYVETLKSPFVALEEAAIEMVDKLPAFVPAVREGRAITQRIALPLRFSLR